MSAATIGCGSDSSNPGPDSPTGNYPPPRVISGGGIGDGPIDGVVNFYAIDDNTRAAIAGAAVTVGTVTGTTDSTGLFVANGVTGAQTIAVSATGYRSELWIGANGANITADLHSAIDPATTQANLAGTISGFDAVTVPSGHHKTAVVTYSNDEHATDAENNLATANSANICDAVGTAGCSFTVTTRTGHVALLAEILDHDLNGTPTDPTDDKFTVIGWATLTGLVVADGIDQTGLTLSMIAAGNLGSVSVDFGTPPSSLPDVFAVAGVELGGDGTLEIPALASPTAPTVAIAPSLTAYSSATYRLTALASDTTTSTGDGAQSAQVIRGIAQAQLATATWLGVPGGLTMTRTGASWTALAGALVQGASYDTSTGQHLLSVTSFDGSTAFTIPDALALPASGSLVATATALQGTIDLTNFSIDTDLDKITGSSEQQITIE
ncbi:MAG TPA: hypothetical protein VMJ10_35930 [Kofleriaceae bacterium]|nr:hypothetical protein [Kofleriaceae bacterium]